jgi:hypothetical protein
VEALHIHHLDRGSLSALSPRIRRRAPRHVKDGYRARKLLKDADRPVKVITLVRDVVERNLSVGFARLRRSGPPDVLGQLVQDDRLIDELWRTVDVDVPNWWFDVEIRGTLGIDVFGRPFPAAGHERFREGRCDLLVLRSDVADDIKSAAVSELLGRPVEVLRGGGRTRQGGELEGVYEQFKRAVPLTDDDLRLAAQSQLMQHFFEVDAEEYVSSWRQRLGR